MASIKRSISWIWIFLAAIVFILAAVTLVAVVQGLVHQQINDFQSAAAALDCPAAEEAAGSWNGILRPLVGEDQAAAAAEFLAECRGLAEARAAAGAGDFAAAQTRLGEFATQNPSSRFLPTVTAEGQDAYLARAEAEHAAGRYEDALKLFAQFISDNPSASFSPFGTRAKAGYLAALQDWVGELRTGDRYGEALSACDLYAVDPFLTAISWCGEVKPAVLFEWGNHDAAAGRKDESDAHFLAMLALIDSASPMFAEMLDQHPEVMLAWADDLRAAGELLKALEVVSALKDVQTDPEILELVDDKYSLILQDLAEDPGKDGQTVIRQAVDALCGRHDDPLPAAVGFVKNAARLGYYCPADSGASAYYPASRLAARPSELFYYVHFSTSTEEVQRCLYTPGTHTLIRLRYKLTVYVMLVGSRKEQYRKTFYGLNPVACPQMYGFSMFETEKPLYGSPVNADPVKAWLEAVIR